MPSRKQLPVSFGVIQNFFLTPKEEERNFPVAGNPARIFPSSSGIGTIRHTVAKLSDAFYQCKH